MPPVKGKLRRNIDLRLVSFALSVLKDNPDNAELAVASRLISAAALQLSGGLKALIMACRATASSEAIRRSMEPAQARHCEILFEALAESLEQHQKSGFQELIELIVVFASESMDEEDRHGLVVWANSLGLSTEPLVIHDDDDDDIDVVEPDDAIRRRTHKPRKRSTREAYREDRYEDLAREAIAKGFDKTEVKVARSRVRLYGVHPRNGLVHLRWLRCPMTEADELSQKLNKELASMKRTEPGHDNLPT